MNEFRLKNFTFMCIIFAGVTLSINGDSKSESTLVAADSLNTELSVLVTESTNRTTLSRRREAGMQNYSYFNEGLDLVVINYLVKEEVVEIYRLNRDSTMPYPDEISDDFEHFLTEGSSIWL